MTMTKGRGRWNLGDFMCKMVGLSILQRGPSLILEADVTCQVMLKGQKV